MQPFAQNEFFCSIFFLTEKFHGNCNFLEKGCVMAENSRKETPLKIQFYYQDIINLPIKTFSKAWKWQPFDFGPTFTHFYLLKNVNFKIQFVLRFVL